MVQFNKYLKPVIQQRGATLLEVMVSVFIMAFGIMALMLAQIKSVGSVREAEMQTRVAQATQNLAEGMLTNPEVRTLTGLALPNATYQNYNQASRALTPVPSSPGGVLNVCGSTNITSSALVTCHLGVFEADLLRALPNAGSINYNITTNATSITTITVNWTEVNGEDNFPFSYSLAVGN